MPSKIDSLEVGETYRFSERNGGYASTRDRTLFGTFLGVVEADLPKTGSWRATTRKARVAQFKVTGFIREGHNPRAFTTKTKDEYRSRYIGDIVEREGRYIEPEEFDPAEWNRVMEESAANFDRQQAEAQAEALAALPLLAAIRDRMGEDCPWEINSVFSYAGNPRSDAEAAKAYRTSRSNLHLSDLVKVLRAMGVEA